jgi:hypothetical protein
MQKNEDLSLAIVITKVKKSQTSRLTYRQKCCEKFVKR